MRYVGITSRDPYIRKREWESLGRVLFNFQIIHSGLTYEEAQKIEDSFRSEGFLAEPGGPKISGKVYSVYTFEY